jgi:hypothetical protein
MRPSSIKVHFGRCSFSQMQETPAGMFRRGPCLVILNLTLHPGGNELERHGKRQDDVGNQAHLPQSK